MKKVLVVLLILAVAGGVFAQDLTWSGTVETGVHITKKDGADDVLVWADNDDDVQGVRAKLQAAVTGDSWGFKVGTKVETSDAAYKSAAQLYNGYGWFDLLGGMIKLSGGLIDDAVWTTQGAEDWGFATGSGVRLEVVPIEGLNVSAFLTWPKGDGSNAGSKTTTLEQFFKETAIGVSYTAEAFYVSVGAKLDSDGDPMGTWFDGEAIEDGDDAGSPGGTDDDINMKILVGFGYTGLPALTAKVEGNIWNLGKYSDYGVMWFNETIAYKVMDPLTVGAVFTEKLLGNSDLVPVYLKLKPYVEYTLSDAMTVGLELPVELWDGFDTLGVKPWFKYAVGDNASVKISYAAAFLAERTDSKVHVRPESALNHDVQATFAWSF
jgi:hypothetical protein